MANIQVPMIKLNNGAEMPQVGLGLWKVDKDTCAQSVSSSLDSLICPGPQFLSLSILTAALVLHNIPRTASPFLSTLLFLLSWLP